MCCCGDDTKTMTLVAGILALIQSFVGIVLSSVDIDTFFSYGVLKAPIIVQALDNTFTIRILLVVFLALQVSWFISSLGLLHANQKNQSGGVRQWLVFTSLVIVAEVVFPIIALSVTVVDASNGLMTQTVVNYSSSSGSYYSKTIRTYFIAGFMNSYLTMIFTFSKAGLITLITNIVMCVYAGRRADTITHGTTGRILPPIAPVTVVVPSQMVGPYVSGQRNYQTAGPVVFPGQYQQMIYPGQQIGPQHMLYQGPQQVPFQQQPPPYSASAQQQQEPPSQQPSASSAENKN